MHTAQEKLETGDEKVVFSSVCGLPKGKKIGILICQDYTTIAVTLPMTACAAVDVREALSMNEMPEKNTTESSDNQQTMKVDRNFYEWVQALVASVLAVLLLFTFVIRMISVDGTSMLPTLQDGDRLLVLDAAWCGDLRYGDIVVLRKETFYYDPIVKRIIAVGGQTVDIDFSTGSVYVDGELLEEAYINDLTYDDEGLEFPVTVDEGCIFVMGDNRNASDDSRNPRLGVVDERYVLGRAAFLLFPGKDSVTKKPDYSRIGFIRGLE